MREPWGTRERAEALFRGPRPRRSSYVAGAVDNGRRGGDDCASSDDPRGSSRCRCIDGKIGSPHDKKRAVSSRLSVIAFELALGDDRGLADRSLADRSLTHLRLLVLRARQICSLPSEVPVTTRNFNMSILPITRDKT